MPFTLSHLAVALPFARSPLPVSALALGTVSPDFPLYAPIGLMYDQTHSLAGAVLVATPLAFMAWLLWGWVVQPVLGDLVPGWVASRLPVAAGGRRLTVASVAALVGALLVGTLSHVLLDDLTHAGRWGGDAISAATAGWAFPLTADRLQLGVSALGLGILAVWAGVTLRRATPIRRTPAARTSFERRRRTTRSVRWLYYASLVGCVAVVFGATVAGGGVPSSAGGWFDLGVAVYLGSAGPAVGATLVAASGAGYVASRVRVSPTRVPAQRAARPAE